MSREAIREAELLLFVLLLDKKTGKKFDFLPVQYDLAVKGGCPEHSPPPASSGHEFTD